MKVNKEPARGRNYESHRSISKFSRLQSDANYRVFRFLVRKSRGDASRIVTLGSLFFLLVFPPWNAHRIVSVLFVHPAIKVDRSFFWLVLLGGGKILCNTCLEDQGFFFFFLHAWWSWQDLNYIFVRSVVLFFVSFFVWLWWITFHLPKQLSSA